MESQQHANPGGGGDDTDHVANDEPGLPLENYEFTFDLAQLPGSGNMSFIEPEVCRTTPQLAQNPANCALTRSLLRPRDSLGPCRRLSL